jgi:hypothetical protein
MKTKVLYLRDDSTLMPCIVVQFEELDREFCDKAGFAPGLKVVLRFSGSRVTCLAGFDLRDAFGGRIENLSECMRPDGTIIAFKEILHFVDDIRVLPDNLDVESFREEFFRLSAPPFLGELGEVLEERSSGSLRKVLYAMAGWIHLAIVDVETTSVVYDRGSTSGRTDTCVWADYLWVPLRPLSTEEAGLVSLSPFRHDILTLNVTR